MHQRLDARAGSVRRHVNVRNQANDRRIRPDRRGQRGHHVAVVVEESVVSPERHELVDEHPAQVELAGRARAAGALARGLRVHARVTDEALEQALGQRLSQR
jgi:hypothetical protein